jgi:hypothetical protein
MSRQGHRCDVNLDRPSVGVAFRAPLVIALTMLLAGGHGDHIGEAAMTQKDTRYPELTARLIEEFLDS